MKLESYVKALSLEQAYELLKEEDSVILGGGAWLKLSDQKKKLGIDLDGLDLNNIREDEEYIHIGSTVTLYQLETSEVLKGICDGILSRSASMIMGVQVRNIATIGGTVCGKYGFSDLIPSLLALGASLVFFNTGVVSLEEFMNRKGKPGDILLEVLVPKLNGRGYVEAFKKTSIDFPY